MAFFHCRWVVADAMLGHLASAGIPPSATSTTTGDELARVFTVIDGVRCPEMIFAFTIRQ